MPAPSIKKATVFEDAGATCMARVVGNDAANITQASISGITGKLYETSDGSLAATLTVTPADNVFDTLQTDDRWTEDTDGYNFRHTVADSQLANGNTLYEVEYKFDPASGNDFVVKFQLHTLPLRMS